MKPTKATTNARPNLRDSLLDFERTLIHTALVACDWNQRKAADALGVLPTTLSEKIQRLGIVSPKPRVGRVFSPDPQARSSTRPSLPAIEFAAPVNGWCRTCGHDAREV